MLDVEALLDDLADRVADRLAERVPPPETDGWRLLDLEEAADRLGRSPRWVRQRVRNGELQTVRLDGGALAFELEALQAFAAARRVGSSEVAGR